jgi:hypothetical protein
MRVLSIDIGIKHLAHCLFDVSDTITIDNWDVTDLTEGCTCSCSKKAVYQFDQSYYCKSHFTDFSLVQLISFCTSHRIPLGTKSEMKKNIKQKMVPFSFTLIELGQQIIKRYANFNADIVLIENQIGPLASKMKAVQGLIVQYWLMRGAKVECISACNKLKLFHNEKTTYAQRKKLSIQYTKQLLDLNNFTTSFLTHKKKDDLADTFLQGVWYFQNNNCGLLKINCS